MKKNCFIAVIGASGKMGQELHQVLQTEKIKHFGITKSGNAENYSETYKFESAPKMQLQGVIDFSLPEAFEQALQYAKQNKAPLVSGTTGLSQKQFQQMKKISELIPILWSANMSIGIAVLQQALQSFSALHDFDFQIEDFHHKRKKDAPSGTGISLQANLEKIVSKKLPPILSIRAGGIIGTHKVHAVSNEEHLIFEHQALSRRVFANGAVKSLFWLQKQKKGLYSIEDMIRAN